MEEEEEEEEKRELRNEAERADCDTVLNMGCDSSLRRNGRFLASFALVLFVASSSSQFHGNISSDSPDYDISRTSFAQFRVRI